jgi:hypothetical protein
MFKFEVRLVWKARGRWTKVLYISARYSQFLLFGVFMYQSEFHLSSPFAQIVYLRFLGWSPLSDNGCRRVERLIICTLHLHPQIAEYHFIFRNSTLLVMTYICLCIAESKSNTFVELVSFFWSWTTPASDFYDKDVGSSGWKPSRRNWFHYTVLCHLASLISSN